MSILRVGSNKKYSEGWEKAFGGRKKSRKSTKGKAAPKKKSGKKR